MSLPELSGALEGLKVLDVGDRPRYRAAAEAGKPTSLAGNRLRTLRRQVGLVESLPEVEVMPFEAGHAEACLELLRRWHERHRAAHGGDFAALLERLLRRARRRQWSAPTAILARQARGRGA